MSFRAVAGSMGPRVLPYLVGAALVLSGAAVAGHMVLLFLSIALWWGIGYAIENLAWSALIVAVNAAFYRLTGYGPDEIMGRNCRFLSGSQGDQAGRSTLRSAVAEGRPARSTASVVRRPSSRSTS